MIYCIRSVTSGLLEPFCEFLKMGLRFTFPSTIPYNPNARRNGSVQTASDEETLIGTRNNTVTNLPDDCRAVMHHLKSTMVGVCKMQMRDESECSTQGMGTPCCRHIRRQRTDGETV